MGCEVSWDTNVGLEEEKRDCINPLTEGARKICGRTSIDVESIAGSF